MDPYKIILLTEEPGVYKVEFDNNFSWYNPKLLRYRVCVLTPVLDELSVRQKLAIFSKSNSKT